MSAPAVAIPESAEELEDRRCVFRDSCLHLLPDSLSKSAIGKCANSSAALMERGLSPGATARLPKWNYRAVPEGL